jgi:acyl-CoA thioester hydrolase
MGTTLPTFDQVMEIPAALTGTVSADFIDANGHMNVVHYLNFAAAGADVVCRDIGIDDAYRANRRMSTFTVEHHLRYFSELREGDKLSVHPRVLDRSDKVVHILTLLLDRTRERLASTTEIVLVHVNIDTRRPVPMPDDIAAGWDRHIAAATTLAWPAPLCGVMGVRR